MGEILDNGLLMFSLIIGFIGLVLLMVALVSLQKARKTELWGQTKGKVLESDVVKGLRTSSDNTRTTTYRPEICYQYEVNGEVHVSNRIKVMGNYSSNSSARAYRAAIKYPKDSEVTVFYDHNKPEKSVLERGVTREINSLLAVGLIMLVGALILAYSQGLLELFE
jgi:hypothetical protein